MVVTPLPIMHNKYKSFILLNHLHLTLSKHLRRSITRALLTYLNIFLQVASSFVVNNLRSRNNVSRIQGTRRSPKPRLSLDGRVRVCGLVSNRPIYTRTKNPVPIL
jgi:hypothetical protein